MMCLFYDNAVILKKDTMELPQISYCSVPVTVARIVKMPFIRKLAILLSCYCVVAAPSGDSFVSPLCFGCSGCCCDLYFSICRLAP